MPLSQDIKSALNAQGDAPIYACRAWVNFNGTGTIQIRGSGNVSSITDGGVGIYTVNFNNAMPDANYAANISVSAGAGLFTEVGKIEAAASMLAGSVLFKAAEYNNTLRDSEVINVSIFR